MDTKEFARRIAKLILSKKGYNIKILDLRNLTPISDFFIIASADSHIQVKAIADEIDADSNQIKYFEDKIPTLLAMVDVSYDIPESYPQTNFKMAMASSICPVTHAEDIIGQFVLYSRRSPTWLISCTDAPLPDGTGGGVLKSPVRRHGFAFCGVDDKTGKAMFFRGTTHPSGFKR